MALTTGVLRLTADMIQRRDDVRLVMGPHYEANVSEARGVLRRMAAAQKKQLAEAALDIAHQMESKGCDPSLIIAALVDECEHRPEAAACRAALRGGEGAGK